MLQEVAGLVDEALGQSKDAVMYRMSQRLAQAFPERYVLETEHWAFDIHEYAKEGLCLVELRAGVHSQLDSDPDEKFEQVAHSPYNAWYEVEWQGHEIEVITIGVFGDYCRNLRHFVIAADREVAESFLRTVGEWNAEVRGEVLVYNGGWYKDADLFEAIKNSTLENLVLEGQLREQIRDDFETFFRSRRTYERYGIPWKRGVLLLGPPGNGKTHCIKALVNLLGLPCLYARTFRRDYGTDQGSIREVFARACQAAPCILVLEDLDSLLDEENRSFFLNELDGFGENAGIMVVATTNHPERLDPAILERPSRFDRKYTFHLPDELCRSTYLMRFSQTLEPELRLDERQASIIAGITEGFSYAYLKELFLSAMMAWIHGTDRPFLELMQEQVQTLKGQMHTAPEGSDTEGMAELQGLPPEVVSYMAYMSRWQR